jgi:hypothetical protein
MLDDDQFEQLLRLNQLVKDDTLAACRRLAHTEGRSLYAAVMTSGSVDEHQVVQLLAPMLGIGGVLLRDFQGDSMLMSLAPVHLLREHGMLPVGIQEMQGRRVLLLAMADPTNDAALVALRQYTSLPLQPLLAGPRDLLEAIERAADHHLKSSAALDAVLVSEELLDDDDFLIDSSGSAQALNLAVSSDFALPPTMIDHPEIPLKDMMSDLESHAGAGVVSALSLIDDMPRDRHSAATPADGVPAVSAQIRRPTAPPPPPVAPPAPITARVEGISDLFPAVGAEESGPARGPGRAPAQRRTVALEDPHFLARQVQREVETTGSVSATGGDLSFAPPILQNSAGADRSPFATSGTFQRVSRPFSDSSGLPAVEGDGLEALLTHPGLARALASLMVRRGLLSAHELRTELERQD